MIGQDLNDGLIRVGSGSDAGGVLRGYSQLALLSDEFASERPVVAMRMMGEDLVPFRDNKGDQGLIGRHCQHRGADPFFGRREDNGLCNAFHGWHFDRNGQFVEQSGEPESSRMHEQNRTSSPDSLS